MTAPRARAVDRFNKAAADLASMSALHLIRGPSGYGMEFHKANYKDLGGSDLKDEVYAARFLAATECVDPKKIGITGGSLGIHGNDRHR